MKHLYRREFLLSATSLAGLTLAGPAAFAETTQKKQDDTAPEDKSQDNTAKDNMSGALEDMFLGKDDAPVTIIEYASATCPHCKDFHEQTFPTLKKDYVDTGKVKYIFREFPNGDLALAAFMVARCAPKDKYFGIIDLLFARQEHWAVQQGARDELFKIAQLAGFSRDQFDACLKNEKVAKGIIDIYETGAKDYGVNSTPTLFINGAEVRGNQDIAKIREMIDSALK